MDSREKLLREIRDGKHSIPGTLVQIDRVLGDRAPQGDSPIPGSRTTVMGCPWCGRVASIPEWCTRPICVHAWDGNVPEIWDGDDTNGSGRPIEHSPNESFRTPGTNTWALMVPVELK